jgi:hypothetical protein
MQKVDLQERRWLKRMRELRCSEQQIESYRRRGKLPPKPDLPFKPIPKAWPTVYRSQPPAPAAHPNKIVTRV